MPNLFEGHLIRLRAIEPADWQLHYQWNFDSEIGRLTDEVWFPTSRESVRAWAEAESKRHGENDNFRFEIETLDGEVVGTINTHSCHRRNGTFMYGLAILPDHQHHGYATEAIRLVLRFYFQERRYQKVTVEVYSFNEPSIRLHEALGFTLEGRLRRMIYTEGTFHDVLMFGLTDDEFAASDWNED